MTRILLISTLCLLISACNGGNIPANVSQNTAEPKEEWKPAEISESGMVLEEIVAPKKVDIAPVDENYFIPNRFKGKTIIVTGAARGIGKATAVRAAREGANIVIADWLPVEGQATADEIVKAGGKAHYVRVDIQSTEDCEKMVAEAVSKFGAVDLAVLNAGVMDGGYSGDPFDYEKQKHLLPNSIHDASDTYWERVMNINATGTFRSMRSVLRQMLKQGRGGAIVVVGSIAGLTGLAGNPAYVASKHAVEGLVRNAAVDYAPYGIRVNSVNMAATATDMVKRAGEFVMAQREAGIGGGMGGAKTRSLLATADSKNRDATVWEQASTMLYLISDDASNITGALYATDGGWTAY